MTKSETEPVMAVYPLRNISLDLWKRVQKRAIDDDRTVRDVILELLKGYASGKFRLS